MYTVPEHISSPSSYGREHPGCDVPGGVDSVATVASQRNANEQHKQTHSKRLAAHCSWFVSLVGQSHQTQQKHCSAKHLEISRQDRQTHDHVTLVLCRCQSSIQFQIYLVKESSHQREVWCRIGGKDASCCFLTGHSQVSSTVIMDGFCHVQNNSNSVKALFSDSQ